MRKHLIIPDAHANPKYDNDRFTALGNFILDEQPDVIICIGDFADMASLSAYDKGKASFEGRRYKADIESVHDALTKLHSAVNKHNSKKNPFRKKQYTPKQYMTLGNHDARILRAANDLPELDGHISIDDLHYRIHGWELTPYKESITVDGIAYSHYFASGLKGAPISGENIGANLVKKLHMSAVQGHSHLFNHYEHTRPNGDKIFGLSVGCYSHHKMVEDWNRNTKHMWWEGVVILEGCGRWDGYYEELRAVCQRKILDSYG